ncbi:hypothetical protein N8445_00255 [bacterium]|nr:hypothetical protein [bacterium]
MKTLTEKYRGVLNESFKKSQFVKDARLAHPHLITQFNGFSDTVSILKQKGMISEEDKIPEYSEFENISDEAIRRGIDIELEEMGLMSEDDISDEDQGKAKDKVLKNLKKDPLHYLNIMSGESNKVDKHDREVEVKKGKEVDTFNGMKKAELKESYDKQSLLKKLGDADDAKIQTGNGREYIVYNPNSNNDDNAAMWHDTSVFAVDQDGGEHEIDYKDIGLVMVDETSVNEYDQTDAVADYIKDHYRNPKTGKSLIDDEVVDDFYKTHPEWEEQADGSEEGMQAVLDNFEQFLLANYEMPGDFMQEKVANSVEDVIDPADYGMIGQGYLKGFNRPHSLDADQLETLGRKVVDSLYKGDFDKAKAKFVKEVMGIDRKGNAKPDTDGSDATRYKAAAKNVGEQMTDQQMADIAKYGQEDKVVKAFKPGDMFSSDFDYEGMLEFGLKIRLNTPIGTLKALYDSFEDVNYHSENSHLGMALDAIEAKDKSEALDHIRNFKKAIKQTLVSFNEGADPNRDVEEYVDPKAKLFRPGSTDDGEEMNERVGSLQEFISLIQDRAAENDTTEVEEVEEVMYALGEHYNLGVDIMHGANEAQGKDHDGDGDVDGDDYMAAKDKAIKKAMGKDEIVKENIKTIISKILEEGVINEAATNELAKLANTYGGFEGMKSVLLQLQDVVTDIESYYDKTRGKIQKAFDAMGDVRNEEGLKVGAFISPAVESAFNKDLRPAIRSGFTKGLDQPKVKVISQRDIDRHNTGAAPLGEAEPTKETVYSPPVVNGTLRETKK